MEGLRREMGLCCPGWHDGVFVLPSALGGTCSKNSGNSHIFLVINSRYLFTLPHDQMLDQHQ
jgi:hypothetical protein